MTIRAVLVSGLFALASAFLFPGVSEAGVQYVYDSSGRLIRAVYSNGVTVDYVYDSAGNRRAINRATGSNAAPNAVNDMAATSVSTAVNILVRTNDTDPNGQGLTVTAAHQPTAGVVTIESAGAHVRYTPPATAGTYHFNYVISDGAGGLDVASVTVTVTGAPPSNTPPVAVDDEFSLFTANTTRMTFVANVRANDTDAEGHGLTITSVTQPSNGAVATVQNGSVTVSNMPVGDTMFTYTISDGFGGSDTGSVIITREYESGA